MKKQLKIILLASHLALFGAGVGLGIYKKTPPSPKLKKCKRWQSIAESSRKIRKAATPFTGRMDNFLLRITKLYLKVM